MNKPVGYWGITHGVALELVEIRHGADDKAVIKWSGSKLEHMRKISTDADGRQFIMFNRSRWYLDECVKNS